VWAEIGVSAGQRNLSVTADRYTHAMMDYREIDRRKLLTRLRLAARDASTRGLAEIVA